VQTRYQHSLNLFHPRYWLTWTGIALAFVLTRLPQTTRRRLARLLGRGAVYLAPRRVRIARVNLGLCFPDLTPEAHAQLLQANLRSTAEGLIETGTTWLHPEKLKDLTVRFIGLEHLDRTETDPGILIIGMHFATLDLAGALLSRQRPFNVMYKTNKNPVLEWLMQRGRGHHFKQALDQHNIRGVIRNLKAGNRLWYAPDQDYGRQNAVFAPFFGMPAATTTAANRIARLTGAKVVFMSHYRHADGSYSVVIKTPETPFPTQSDLEDTSLINRQIQHAINDAPEQYWWVHRRFKSTEHGHSALYDA
jgi:KDO2-lipid IV(A) lauroyltransferase|tara:strand:+ start:2191 stop:3108 length:918 start_codon:yes stop_codon:yes gene_type:complete